MLTSVCLTDAQSYQRIAHKLQPVAAADKTNPFPTTRPPRADRFKRWLGSAICDPTPQTSRFPREAIPSCGRRGRPRKWGIDDGPTRVDDVVAELGCISETLDDARIASPVPKRTDATDLSCSAGGLDLLRGSRLAHEKGKELLICKLGQKSWCFGFWRTARQTFPGGVEGALSGLGESGHRRSWHVAVPVFWTVRRLNHAAFRVSARRTSTGVW